MAIDCVRSSTPSLSQTASLSEGSEIFEPPHAFEDADPKSRIYAPNCLSLEKLVNQTLCAVRQGRAAEPPQELVKNRKDCPLESGLATFELGAPLSIGFALTGGERDYMEDRQGFSAFEYGEGKKGVIAIVCDGHGDKGLIAEHVVNNFAPMLSSAIAMSLEVEGSDDFLEIFTNAITSICLTLHEETKIFSERVEGTCLLALIAMEGKRYFVNVGDSRAVLATENGEVYRLSEDASPKYVHCAQEIIRAGGDFSSQSGCLRVGGVLAVARDIGIEIPGVIHRPKITVASIEDGESDAKKGKIAIQRNDALILASDGLWDVLSDHQAAELVLRSLKNDMSPERAAQEIVKKAYELGSRDNITAQIILNI